MKDKSRKFFLLVLFVMMAACNVCAENYPYRSDFGAPDKPCGGLCRC